MILRITLLHGLGFTRPPLWLQPLIPNPTCWSPGVKFHVQSTARFWWSVELREFKKDGRGDFGFWDPQYGREVF